MGAMQQRKGRNFELFIANLVSSTLRAFGVVVALNPAQRKKRAGRDMTINTMGGPFCVQISHGKTVNPWKKLKEAQGSARDGELSVAILRKDYQPIIAVMGIKEWLLLVERALRG